MLGASYGCVLICLKQFCKILFPEAQQEQKWSETQLAWAPGRSLRSSVSLLSYRTMLTEGSIFVLPTHIDCNSVSYLLHL